MGLKPRVSLPGALALGAVLACGAVQGLSAQGDGVLRGGRLHATVDEAGEARLRVEYTLLDVPASGRLSIWFLHSGAAPAELTARLFAEGPESEPVVHAPSLPVTREGLRQGWVPTPESVADTVLLVIDAANVVEQDAHVGLTLGQAALH